MTSKEKVLSVYPDAHAEEYRLSGWRLGATRFLVLIPGKNASGGDTEAEAWDDAASKLPSAPSPAGETASEERFECPWLCGDVVPHTHIRGGPFAPKEYDAVPEPVSTEGAANFGYRGQCNVCHKTWGFNELVSRCPYCISERVDIFCEPDRDYCCGAAYCDDQACNTHGEKDADDNLLYWEKRDEHEEQSIQREMEDAANASGGTHMNSAPATALLADVMHLWMDGYISKNQNSCADDSVSGDVFEKIDAFLRSEGIAVDYCGWSQSAKPSAEGDGWIAGSPPECEHMVATNFCVWCGRGPLSPTLTTPSAKVAAPIAPAAVSDRIAEIESRLAAITPGPWRVLEVPRRHEWESAKSFIGAVPYEGHPYKGHTRYFDVLGDEDYPTKASDQKFIAAAPDDIRFLLDQLRAQPSAEKDARVAELKEIVRTGSFYPPYKAATKRAESAEAKLRAVSDALDTLDGPVEIYEPGISDEIKSYHPAEEVDALFARIRDLVEGK